MTPAPENLDRHDQIRRASRFLTDVGRLLASSLDDEETVAGVAQFAVETMADFCIVDVVEDGQVNRLRVAHADPGLAALVGELLAFPLDRRRPHLSLTALETRRSVLVSDVTAAFLDSTAQGPAHRRILEALRPRSLMAVPMLGRDHVLGVVLFVSSDRRYDADDLALAEGLVRLGAVQVENARLYREAQRAVQARERVLGIVAHDLRNPLNVIEMSAQILLDDTFSPAQHVQQTRMILRSAQRMERLIEDLLDIARIEADRLTLHREIHQPADVAGEAVELNLSLAAAKSLSLHLEAAADLPAISADRHRMLQVLSNLIGNAIKFTPEGGSIEVAVEAADEGVRFTVVDTGIGIEPESLPNLFQPFWQVERRSLEGVGLGLMIARGIVDAHGGSIGVESTPGQGSRFHFTIPAATPPSEGERRRGPGDRRVRTRKVAELAGEVDAGTQT